MEVDPMDHKRMKNRLLSFAVLLAILLPMISLTAYGATSKFSFGFNGSTSTWYAFGQKSVPTYSRAKVDVTTGDFGIGQVKFTMTDTAKLEVTLPVYVSAQGSYTLSYFRALPSNMGYLSGTPTNPYVWGCGGTFTP